MRTAIRATRDPADFAKVSPDLQTALVAATLKATSVAIRTLETLVAVRHIPATANALSQFHVREDALNEALSQWRTAQTEEQGLGQSESDRDLLPAAQAKTSAAAKQVGDYLSSLLLLIRAVHPVIAQDIAALSQLIAQAGCSLSHSLTAMVELEAANSELALQPTEAPPGS